MDIREPSAISLIERLEDISYSDRIMFGHQNAGHIGISISAHDGTESDVKNLTGSHPAVVGIDTLSFYGYEGTFDQLIKVVKQLHREGAVITLSSHMPNFTLGGRDFYDYSPNVTDGDCGRRILPGGDLNNKFRRFLDKIAELAKLCIDISGERIPMIIRPFHECNGDWFWWGRPYLDDDEFIKLFRYTIDYLRDDCGIRNLLYCYSPNGQFHSRNDYMSRYPGDDYVDVMGMDIYHDRPAPGDGFWKDTLASLEILSACAEDRGKVYALTETGARTLDDNSEGYFEGLAPSGNRIADWYTEMLEELFSQEAGRRLAYILTWPNFSDTQFWVPYEKDGFRHEMCDDFVRFCSDPRIIMAGNKKDPA